MIVSDSTTLIILFNLKRTDLLSNLFDKIYIPKAVYKEISFKEKVVLSDLFEVVEVKNRKKVDELKFILDDGESEAIALALEKNLSLIIDEKKGRKIAKNLGLKIVGFLGIVYLNIKKGFVTKEEAEEFLRAAIKNGFRIDERLIYLILDKV